MTEGGNTIDNAGEADYFGSNTGKRGKETISGMVGKVHKGERFRGIGRRRDC